MPLGARPVCRSQVLEQDVRGLALIVLVTRADVADQAAAAIVERHIARLGRSLRDLRGRFPVGKLGQIGIAE